MHTSSLTIAALSLSGALAFPRVRQYNNRTGGSETDRAQAVIDAFRFAWNGYSEHCFGQDELHPSDNSCGNSRNGWGASAVDALSTALIMGQTDIVEQITDYIPTVDFSQNPTRIPVSLFETTIRYLGGMLSGYDLLNGPFSDMQISEESVNALLNQSVILADKLKYAFDTPSGVPYNDLWINTNAPVDGQRTNGLATVGTLVLEWQRLSDLVGDPEYGRLAQKAEQYLLNPQPPSSVPWPGLTGTDINITSGLFVNADGSWSGGCDSAYEYYLKMFVYNADEYGNYGERWVQAADSTMEHLASHPSSRPDLTFLAQFSGQNLRLISQHLTCFDGGNFILGGLVLGRQEYVDFGLSLVDGCHETYTQTTTGIGPESFAWEPSAVPDDQASFYDQAGFYITNPVYVLRPEVIESYYYAYRATGDAKYQDWAWDGFVAINATTRTGSGFTSISDVQDANGGASLNNQESFLFAEVMKYSYLIHAPDAEFQVKANGENEFVYNTEAHPIRVAGRA